MEHKFANQIKSSDFEPFIFQLCRLKDSREHTCRVENMLSMCQELHHIKRARDQKLSLQKEEASALNGRVEGLEKDVKGLFLSLYCQDNHHGDNAVSNPSAVSGYKKLPTAATLPEDTRNTTDDPSERSFLVSTQSTQIKKKHFQYNFDLSPWILHAIWFMTGCRKYGE